MKLHYLKSVTSLSLLSTLKIALSLLWQMFSLNHEQNRKNCRFSGSKLTPSWRTHRDRVCFSKLVPPSFVIKTTVSRDKKTSLSIAEKVQTANCKHAKIMKFICVWGKKLIVRSVGKFYCSANYEVFAYIDSTVQWHAEKLKKWD